MLRHGVVDELRILVYPFAFGKGLRIFENFDVTSLTLDHAHTFKTGVVALRYAVKGGA
jgi:dihydrofolate reductase